MFRLVAAAVAATSLGVMVGMAVLAVKGEPPPESPPQRAVTVSLSLAKPSDPPNSSSATSTEAAPERTIVAVPRMPGPAAPAVPATAVPKPVTPVPVLSRSASPPPTVPPARLHQQSEEDDDEDDNDNDDDDDEGDC